MDSPLIQTPDDGDSYSGDMFDDEEFREYNELLHRTYIAAAMSREAVSGGGRGKKATSASADMDADQDAYEFLDRGRAPEGSASTAHDDMRALFARVETLVEGASASSVMGSAPSASR